MVVIGGRTKTTMMTVGASLQAIQHAAADCRSPMLALVRVAYEGLEGSKTSRRRGRASYPSANRRRSTIRDRVVDRYTA
jgi:hypothetical protein